MTELIYKEESYKIIGACFEVYKEMGCGFLEPVYQECLEKELTLQGIPFDAQKIVALNYKGQKLDKVYKPDFFCYDKIIVEIKAVSTLNNEFRAQTINYLHATNMRLGLLINFGHFPKIEHERFVL
jgi:GxxExxY protein